MRSPQQLFRQRQGSARHKALVDLLAEYYAPERGLPLVLWPIAQRAMLTKDGRPLVCGAPAGMADLVGILTINVGSNSLGLYVEVEVKTGTGRQSKSQRAHERTVESWEGRYLVASSLRDVQGAVGNWIRGGGAIARRSSENKAEVT